MGRSFNQGKRTLVVLLIRGKELGVFIQSGEKNLGRSFNKGKRTCVARSINGKELWLLL